MKLDRNLNLVLTIEREGAPPLHVHSTPISRAVFEANYKLIARAYADIFGRGVAYAIGSGPRIAVLAIKEAGRQNAQEAGRDGDGGADSLLAEVRRLTNVLAPTEAGWEMLPVDVALRRDLLDSEEWEEAEQAIGFFTLVASMTRKTARQDVLGSLAKVIGAQITSSNSTEWTGSLPTLKTDAHSPTRTHSSIPH